MNDKEFYSLLRSLLAMRIVLMTNDVEQLRQEIEHQRIYFVHGEPFKVEVPDVPTWRCDEPEEKQLLWQLEQVIQRVTYILYEAY